MCSPRRFGIAQILLGGMLFFCSSIPLCAEQPLLVEAWIKDGRHRQYETRILGHLDDFQPRSPRVGRYGGWIDGDRREPTGFFQTIKLNNRWWLIDPEGYRFFHIAVCSVSPQKGPQFRKAFPKLFDSEADWAQETVHLLREHGFNGTGCWSDSTLFANTQPRPVYTRRLYFMGSFGNKLGITSRVPGHLGYPNQLIPVFHPEFAAHCDQVARDLETTSDDPYLLGIFSDNELQLPTQSLDRHLQLNPGTYGRQAAETWLNARYGAAAADRKITEGDRRAWIGHVVDRYLTIVKAAIRKHDPNHLFLGPRFHGADKHRTELWQAAGRHLDVIAVNVYGTWSPLEDARQWGSWSQRPFMVTEFYAKGQDSGMKNLTGAGWTVKTQQDRGFFYQNFVLDLIESRNCVGWHYFKYADNDPTDANAEPSNRDSNKGIVNACYEPYEPLLVLMKQLNEQAYSLSAYFDRISSETSTDRK